LNIKTLIKIIFFYSFKILLNFIALLFFIVFVFLFERSYNQSKITNSILKYSDVTDAIVYESPIDQFRMFNYRYTIKINFKNGGSITAHQVDKKGMGNIDLSYIDGFYIIYKKIHNEYYDLKVPDLHLQIWSSITGVQLKNITDIVKEYNIISQYIENTPNIHAYRTLEQIERLSMTTNNFEQAAVNTEVIEYLINLDIFPYIKLGNNQEYFLCRCPPYWEEN